MQHLSRDGQTVVLRRFQAHVLDAARPGQTLIKAAVIDTETDSLDTGTNTITEIAIRPFEFDPILGHVVSIGEPFHAFQEPPAPLTDIIKRITHLDDEMLKGKTINWQAAMKMMSEQDILIAHNAGFDRPTVKNNIERAGLLLTTEGAAWNKIPWACSMSGIDWSNVDSPGLKQTILCLWHGFYYNAHRALDDIDALLYLLTLSRRLPELWNQAQGPQFRLWAVGSSIDKKDVLREHGYKWDAKKKVWFLIVKQESLLDGELAWLREIVYQNHWSFERVKPETIHSHERFLEA